MPRNRIIAKYENLLYLVESQIPEENEMSRRGCRRAILSEMYEEIVQVREEDGLPSLVAINSPKKAASN